MLVLAWIAGLALATRYFGVWEDRQRNPNQAPQSIHGDGYVELRLVSSRQGHYLLNGQINGQGVTFLLDTGATQVAVPEALAARLALERGAPITLEHGQRPRHGLAHAAGPAATRRYPPVRGRGADCAGHGRR